MAMTINKHELREMKRFAEEELGVGFKFDAMINPCIDCSQKPLSVRLSPAEVVELDLEGPRRVDEWKGFAEKVENYMHKGRYSLSSPVWANFGNGRGLSISCNGSYVSATMNSILEKTAEVGMLTKYGAGTSGYFGELRARGTPISVGGTSSGPVDFMEMFDSVTRVVSRVHRHEGPGTHPGSSSAPGT